MRLLRPPKIPSCILLTASRGRAQRQLDERQVRRQAEDAAREQNPVGPIRSESVSRHVPSHDEVARREPRPLAQARRHAALLLQGTVSPRTLHHTARQSELAPLPCPQPGDPPPFYDLSAPPEDVETSKRDRKGNVVKKEGYVGKPKGMKQIAWERGLHMPESEGKMHGDAIQEDDESKDRSLSDP
jgi:hypothetical protein